MKKFFPYLLAATMLIAGFFIGMFTVGQITRNRIERFSSVRTPENFKQHMIQELNLTPEQQKLIDPILEAHGESLRKITTDFRKTFSEEQEKLHSQLVPILTDEQKKIIQKRKQEFERGYKKDSRDGKRRPGSRGEHRKYHDAERGFDGPPPEPCRQD
jgi:hypothetical protein